MGVSDARLRKVREGRAPLTSSSERIPSAPIPALPPSREKGNKKAHSAASSRWCEAASEAEHSAMVTLARAMGLVR